MKLENYSDKIEFCLALFVGLAMFSIRFSMAAGNIFYGLSILTGIFLFFANHRKVTLPTEAKSYAKLYGFLATVIFICVLFSQHFLVSLKAFGEMFIWRLVLSLFIVLFITKKKYIHNILLAFMVVYVIDCAMAFYQIYSANFSNFVVRGNGLSGNVLILAGFITMMLPFSVIVLFSNHFPKRLKNMALVAFLFSFVGSFSDKSRGSWLTCVLCAPFYLWHKFLHNKKVLLATLATIVCAVSLFVSQPDYINRLDSTTNITTDRSNGDRIEAWKSSYHMLEDYPVFGIGLGDFSKFYNSGYRSDKDTQGLVHAHNNIIMFAAENGVVGVSAYLIFLFGFLGLSYRRYIKDFNPYDLIVFTTIFSYLFLFGQIEYTFDNSFGLRTVWFLVACALKLKALDKGSQYELDSEAENVLSENVSEKA